MTIPTLESYIWYAPDYVNLALCDEIVNRSKEAAEFCKGTIGGDTDVVETVRDVDTANIAQWPDLDQKLFEVYGKAINEYATKHPYMAVGQDEGYTLLRYKEKQHYLEHVDAFTSRPRQVTAIIGLNSEYTGGQFWMWGGDWQQRIEKGALLMFPSSFQYPHGVQPIESGTRYSVITWFI